MKYPSMWLDEDSMHLDHLSGHRALCFGICLEMLSFTNLELEKQNVKLDVVEEILRPENKRFVFNPVRICA